MFAGLVVLVVFMLPYLIMFFGSVKTKAEIRSVDPTYFPTEWHWENYVTMWSTPETPLAQNLISTLVISVCATLLVLAVALPAAYYTARFRFPGRLVFLFLVIVTQMVQPAVLTSGLFRQFIALGILDTWAAMILVNAAFNLSFAVWIMHSFFASIPKEVDEAAQIDGAGTFTVLTKINLPLVWPGDRDGRGVHVRRVLERVRGVAGAADDGGQPAAVRGADEVRGSVRDVVALRVRGIHRGDRARRDPVHGDREAAGRWPDGGVGEVGAPRVSGQ